ncbi:hypothetical protein ACFWNG_17625 [Streptomyces sp. NPDC058391]|uniref:COG4315 family predicted lipoprotein n=1 Tax=unclassified Streptomyces TaxID=2593676 RepID=UPI003652E0EC
MRSNTRTATAVATALLCAAALAGCSDSGSGSSVNEQPADFATASGSASTSPSMSSSAPSPDAGKVSAKTGPLGKVLVDYKGRTLYIFEADKTSKSTCDGDCAMDWPPLVITGKPQADKGGVKQSLLSTSTRSDGKKQVTYDGHPLYRFEPDKKADEFNGQGLTAFGAKWYVIGTDGKKITTPLPSSSGSASPSTTSASPSGSASSSSY